MRHSPRSSTRRALSARLEPLEERSLLSVTLGNNFAGLAFGQDGSFDEPPDTIVAVGPQNVVEMVNTALAVYSKTSGGAPSSSAALSSIFTGDGPSGLSLNFTDPQITYDEQQNQFFIGVLAYDTSRGISHFDYALLDGSSPSTTPVAGSVHYLDISEGGNYTGDFDKVGWNADAYFVTTNQFSGNSFSHILEVTIAKSTMAEVNTITSPGDFTVVPATEHGSVSGDPEWFVEEHGFDNGRQLQTIQMVNVLSPTPGFGSVYVNVPSYGAPPGAAQPGGAAIDTGDTRILSAVVSAGSGGLLKAGGHLVATQDVGSGGVARARVYDMIIGGGTVSLNQTLQINPGNGIATYYPAAAIDPTTGDLGITYMESSRKEYMSMYVTGRTPSDALGAIEKPVLAQAGQGTYAGSRAGDYSGIGFDPATGQFWAGSEYALTPSSAFWGTWIAAFSITGGSSAAADQAGLPAQDLEGPIAILLAATGDGSSGPDRLKTK